MVFNEGTEVHPELERTLIVYVLGVKPVKEPVVVGPTPFKVVPPGDKVAVHAPTEGKPLNAIPPVETAQVGCVIVPIIGALGVIGCGLITTDAEANEEQTPSFTVKVYVFGVKPVNVAVVPEPGKLEVTGVVDKVHDPAGKPLKATLPVGTAHVG